MTEQSSSRKIIKWDYLVLGIAIPLAILLSYLNVALPWFILLGGLVFLVLTFFVFKRPFLGILLIILFLPFERIGAYEFGTTTIRLSQIFLVVTALAWFFSLVIKRKYSLVKNPLFIPLGIFLVINLFSLSNSLNLERSLIIFLFIIFTTFLAFLVPNLVKSKDQIKKVILVLLVGFVLVSIFGLWQFLGDMAGLPTEVTGLRELYTKDILGFTRVQSTAYEPLYYANYLLIPIAIIFALFLSGQNIFKSGWLIALFGLGVVNLILTVARGGYLAIVFTLLAVGIFYFRKLFTPYNIIIFIVALVLVGWVVTEALSVGGEFFTIEKFQEHVSGVFYGASYEERIETFDNAITAWREYPLVGIGVGGFGPYMAPHPYYMPKDGWKIVNNEFIEVLAESGILGLLFFCLFILFLVVRSIKAIIAAQDKYLKAILVGLLGAFIGVIVQYQTFSTLYIMHIWFLIGLMIAVQNIIFTRYAKKDIELDKTPQS